MKHLSTLTKIGGKIELKYACVVELTGFKNVRAWSDGSIVRTYKTTFNTAVSIHRRPTNVPKNS